MFAKKMKVNEGDWICSEKSCGNLNFSWREKCNKCGKDKGKVDTFKKTGSEIGRQAATKSGGLFSADDWQCIMCGNVNWARRSECNVCRHPKLAKVEARTGVGGGYCERDNVEYIHRTESDDEIDEFGRRKKKFRKDKLESSSKLDSNTHDETEEDDDDDDDIDLSKYDLTVSDADNDDQSDRLKNNSIKSMHLTRSSSNDRSRSRSRSHDRHRSSHSTSYGKKKKRKSSSRSHSPDRKKEHRRRAHGLHSEDS